MLVTVTYSGVIFYVYYLFLFLYYKPANIDKMEYVNKTVFIIGAGASNEIGMPTGSDLRNNIIDIFTGIKTSQSYKDSSKFLELPDHIIAARNGIYTYFNYDEKIFEKHIDILDEIVQSLELTSSIDNFLYNEQNNPEIQVIGKIAIVSSILKAESECALCDVSKFNNIKPTMEGSWYYSLFLELNKQATLSEFIERLKYIYFIIFNYDRTLEYFLFNAIKRLYKTDDIETGKIIYNMNIYHPYGLP